MIVRENSANLSSDWQLHFTFLSLLHFLFFLARTIKNPSSNSSQLFHVCFEIEYFSILSNPVIIHQCCIIFYIKLNISCCYIIFLYSYSFKMIIGQFNLNAIILYFIICDCETDNFINIYGHTYTKKSIQI